jgi:tungstate transport system permease protein
VADGPPFLYDERLAFSEAFALLTGFDHRVAEIVFLSLQVSGLAVCLGTLVGLPRARAWG